MRARRTGSMSGPQAASPQGDKTGKVPCTGPDLVLGLTCLKRLLDRQQITPGEALLQRRAQQIGWMERRDRADLARAGVEREPASARALDAFLHAEQRL